MSDIIVKTQFPLKIIEIENTFITLKDGCKLAARIWLPIDYEQHKYPAILEYLPYRKRDGTIFRDELTHPYLSSHGYVCIRVDMRGNGESEGIMMDEYLPQEQNDGIEIINWIADQPWSNGNVGMMGISWGGFNSLQIAYYDPKPLKAIVTLCFTDDRFAEDIHYKGGCLLNENNDWGFIMLGYSSRPPDPILLPQTWRNLWKQRLENNPLLTETWLQHQTRDEYWRHGSICENYDNVKCAVYGVSGWRDNYSNCVPKIIQKLKCPKKGLVGPWNHKYPHFAKPGPRIGFLQEMLRWWDKWLKGLDNKIANEPEYTVYLEEYLRPKGFYDQVPGEWISEEEWPSKNIKERIYYLNNQNKLITQELSTEQYIQVNTVQTNGFYCGQMCPYGDGERLPQDQINDDEKSVIFDSEVLQEDFVIFGQPIIQLKLKSNKQKAYIIVRLCEVSKQEGKLESTRITYGVLNLCHIQGSENPQYLEVDKYYNINLYLDDIAHKFQKGNFIRLALSTTYWPLLWPLAENPTLYIDLQQSKFILPERNQNIQKHIVSFDQPETAQPLDIQEYRQGEFKRDIKYDEMKDLYQIIVNDDSGDLKISKYNWRINQDVKTTYEIKGNDPLSAKIISEYIFEFQRDDLKLSIDTHETFFCDENYFYIKAKQIAYENGSIFNEKIWDSKIKRIFV